MKLTRFSMEIPPNQQKLNNIKILLDEILRTKTVDNTKKQIVTLQTKYDKRRYIQTKGHSGTDQSSVKKRVTREINIM